MTRFNTFGTLATLFAVVVAAVGCQKKPHIEQISVSQAAPIQAPALLPAPVSPIIALKEQVSVKPKRHHKKLQKAPALRVEAAKAEPAVQQATAVALPEEERLAFEPAWFISN